MEGGTLCALHDALQATLCQFLTACDKCGYAPGGHSATKAHAGHDHLVLKTAEEVALAVANSVQSFNDFTIGVKHLALAICDNAIQGA